MVKKTKCKKCSRLRPPFAQTPDGCDICGVERTRVQRAVIVTVVEDIKAKGYTLLSGSDYRINKYTLEEPNPKKLKAWVSWRKEVRNKIRTCQDGDDMVFPKAPN